MKKGDSGQMQVYYFILYFFTYGVLGWCTEVAYAAVKQRRFVNRGFLNGPICPIYGVGVSVVLYFLTLMEDSLILLYAASTVLVTVLEGLTGYFLDRIFHHKWWDYSNQPLNIGGFEMMEKIAAELHELSDKMGETIYENVIETIEVREESRKRFGEAAAEKRAQLEEAAAEGRMRLEALTSEQRQKRKARVEELRVRYEEISRQRTRIAGRLLKAFPRMESRKHKAILEELKAKMRDRL